MARLLILCEYPTLLGGERSMLATLDAVAAAGFEIHVAAPPAGPLAELLRQRGMANFPWRVQDGQGVRQPIATLRESLTALLRQADPALLHANSLSTTRIAGPVAANCDVPSLGHIRDIVKLSAKAVGDINAHRRLVAVSHATRDFHIAQGIVASKCFVTTNGIDLKAFCPQPPTGFLHRELRLPPAARFVVTIGQIGLRKATDVILSTAGQIADRAPDLHWLIIGERTSVKRESLDFEASLHALASEPELSGRVHFLGSREDIPAIMRECALLVHPARQEPLGRVLLEAAASGLPAVATDVGGTREIFPTDRSGAVLVPVGDARALAESVLALLCDDAFREELGKAGRRRAEEAFDIQQAAARMVEQYQAVRRE